MAPFSAGGNVDVAARVVAENLQPMLGQPVIVENKTGAGSMIGSEAVARARAPRAVNARTTADPIAIRDGGLAARNYRFGRAQSLLIPSINRNRLGMVVGRTRRPS